MFGIFKKKTQKEILENQYEKLLKESFQLSTINRTESDAKAAEADAVLKKIEDLES
ncbi:Lacal_2735 family protein [Bacteroidia bacterium]|nr:Lacal_2735 family protein [Bacteroidia bacterium]